MRKHGSGSGVDYEALVVSASLKLEHIHGSDFRHRLHINRHLGASTFLIKRCCLVLAITLTVIEIFIADILLFQPILLIVQIVEQVSHSLFIEELRLVGIRHQTHFLRSLILLVNRE